MIVEPWGPVEDLVTAAGSGDAQLRAALDRIGFTAAAGVLVEELLDRCEPPATAEPVVVHLAVTDGRRRDDRAVVFDGGRVRAEPGPPEGAWARVTHRLPDLARALYGTPAASRAAGFVHDRLFAPPPGLTPRQYAGLMRTQHGAALANHALLAAGTYRAVGLDDLAARFGSDKWGALHWYTPHYERHLGDLRDEPVRVLEIGVGGYDDPEAGGGSLRMWQRYFRRGLVYGLDLADKRVPGPRIRVVRGDQGDPDFLAALAAEIGPLDVVIDDGSHVNEHVITSFRALFPHLRDGGYYVVEDLQTAYWPGYGGDPADTSSTATSMGYLKSLVDGLNHREYDRGAEPSYTDRHVVGVHFYHNLGFVQKGRNEEYGARDRLARRGAAAG